MASDSANLLRSRGLHVTAQRIAVLEAVAKRPHGTAEDLTQLARERLGSISQQAVYDALGVLVAKGLLRKLQPAGFAARYEDRVEDEHHHLICRDCSKVVDVDATSLPEPRLKAEDAQGFEIDHAELLFWGRCASCQRRKGNKPRTKP